MGIALLTSSLFTDASLVAYWRLEDLTDSKGSFTLTNNNTVPFNAALFGNGADFGAANTNKFLDTANAIITGDNWTFSFWVKNEAEIASGIYQYFWQENTTNSVQNMIFYEYNSGSRRLVFRRQRKGTSTVDINYSLTMGITDFYLLTMTYDGTTLIAYVNGVNVGSSLASGAGSGGVNHFWISNNAGANTSPVKGVMDDFPVFSRALTAAEILNLYTATSTGGSFLLNFV